MFEDLEPLRGWPGEVAHPVADRVDEIVADPAIDQFYIGRTANLVATRSRHDADWVIPLYSTSSVDNSIDLEEWLIGEFLDYSKNDNVADHGGGGISSHPTHLVYLAVWYRDRSGSDRGWKGVGHVLKALAEAVEKADALLGRLP